MAIAFWVHIWQSGSVRLQPTPATIAGMRLMRSCLRSLRPAASQNRIESRPLWVKSRHFPRQLRWPIYPQKADIQLKILLSAWGPWDNSFNLGLPGGIPTIVNSQLKTTTQITTFGIAYKF